MRRSNEKNQKTKLIRLHENVNVDNALCARIYSKQQRCSRRKRQDDPDSEAQGQAKTKDA